MDLMPLAFFNLGPWEMFLACLVALLLFGPRLPNVMRSLGRGIVEFKKGIRDTEDDLNRQIDSTIEHPADKHIDHKPTP
jgi:sec-independent protein translocase protein TatA